MFKLASHIVAQGPLHPGDAVGWVARLCLALEVIHGVRASHGRISAKSVQMLGPSCHAAGFFLDGVDCADDILYQSPERLGGQGPCPEDDTWALGVLLYHALTGAMPFVGQEAAELRARILWSRPKPLASFGLDNACLQRVMDHVLASDPAGRIQTVTVLRSRLLECHPPAGRLAALKLGKPDVRALSDETDDSQGVKLTGVISREEMERQIREVIARRKAARAGLGRAARPDPLDPWSESDTTRRRSPEAARYARAASAPEPPTTVRSVSVMRSSAALAVAPSGGAEPSLAAARAEAVAVESVSASHARFQSAAGDGSPSGLPALPLGAVIDPDATLHRETGARRGSSASMAVGSGVRRAASPGGVEEFVSVDTDDDGQTLRGEIGLSWDDMPESEVPVSARVSTIGLEPARRPVVAPLGPAPRMAIAVEESLNVPDMRPRWPRLVGGALLVAIGGAGGYLIVGGSGETPAPESPTPLVIDGGSGERPTAPDDTARAEATGSAASLATPAAASASSTLGPRAADTSRCVASFFPQNVIKSGAPEFDFVCGERDVHEGATEIRVALVRARRERGASAAMRELDELGWYQLALFAVTRAACCASPRPLETKVVKHTCPLDERLEQVGRAAAGGDSQALQEALEGFVQATKCLARQGAIAAFGPMRPPTSGGAALLRKMIGRRRAAAAR